MRLLRAYPSRQDFEKAAMPSWERLLDVEGLERD
jgi:hypothetical protein